MTSTRNDVHAPSSASFDPESYDFIACGDNGTPEERPYPPTWAYKALRAAGHGPYAYATPCSCTHCGAALRYYALMLHRPTGEWVYVGETCLDNRFDLSKAEFQNLREASKLNRERSTKSQKVAKLIEQFPFLGEIVELEDAGEFLSSIASQLVSRGELSERQIESAGRALEGHKRYVAKVAASKALEAAEKAAGTIVPVVEGRQVITGTVLSVKDYESNFGYHTTTVWKMLVQDERGFKVFGTVPASIDEALYGIRTVDEGKTYSYAETLKGQKVSFTATVKASDNDEFFGIFSRPVKGSIVD